MNSQRITTRVALAVLALLIGAGLALHLSARSVGAAEPEPTQADTARLLGYMWADGKKSDGVWDVSGPSGTSTLIEYLVERHGGTWVDRGKLRFRLPAPYDWPEWTDSLPDDSQWVRDAVRSQHFLSAVIEAEASTFGVIYDQGGGDPTYTLGRLEGLRLLMRDKGLSTTTREQWNSPDRGQIVLGAADFAKLRGSHRFVCPASGDIIRVPGGEDYDRYGDIRWFTDANRWPGLVRNDCRSGVDVASVRPPVGTCSVRVNDGRVTVDWTYTLGSVSVRRDGGFVESVPAFDRTWSQRPAAGTYTYAVRVFFSGTQADSTCGTVDTRVDGGGGPVDPPPADTCVASDAGGSVLLQWADFGASPYVIRKNGKWLDTVTVRSKTVTGSLADDFLIRYRIGDQVTDVPCTTGDGGGDGDGPCTISVAGNGVRLDFDEVADESRRVVRLNGKWLATLNGVTSYTSNAGDVDDTWVIRHRVAGQVVDITCR